MISSKYIRKIKIMSLITQKIFVICSIPALAESKYFPKPNDFDTEHDFYWYLSQDGSRKLAGLGGVFNAVNMDVYHYAGLSPVKLVDPDGNYILQARKDGTYNYIAENYSGINRRIGRWITINAPFGGMLYQNYLDDNNYINTDSSLLVTISKVGRNIGKIQWLQAFTNKLSKIMPYVKKIGWLGWGLAGADFISNGGSIYKKSELAIQYAGIFEGMDKNFINGKATQIESYVNDMISGGEVEVSAIKTDSGVKFDVNDIYGQLEDLKINIKKEYQNWKLNK